MKILKNNKKIKKILSFVGIIILLIFICIDIFYLHIILSSFEDKEIALRGDFYGELSHDFRNGDYITSRNVIIQSPSENPEDFTPLENSFKWTPKKDFQDIEEWDDHFFYIRFYTESVNPYLKLYDNNNGEKIFEKKVSKIQVREPYPGGYFLSLKNSFYKLETNQKKISPKLNSELIISKSPSIHNLNITELNSPSILGIMFDAWSYGNSSEISINYESLNISIDGDDFYFQNETNMFISNFGHLESFIVIYGYFNYDLYGNTILEFEDADLEMKKISGNLTSDLITNEVTNYGINISNSIKFIMSFERGAILWNESQSNKIEFSFYAESAFGNMIVDNHYKPLLSETISVPKETWIENKIEKDYYLIIASTFLGLLIGMLAESSVEKFRELIKKIFKLNNKTNS